MNFSRLIFLFLVAMVMNGCVRNDAEPMPGITNISRLYISTAEFQTNPSAPRFFNIQLISPADTINFDRTSQSVASEAKGGGLIHYSPITSMMYQASQNNTGDSDTVVYGLEVGRTGTLSNRSRIRNRVFQSVKGLAYHANTDNLYIYDNSTRRIHVIKNPKGQNSFSMPFYNYSLENISAWALLIRGRDLYFTRTGDDGGVSFIEGFVTNNLQNSTFVPKNLTVSGSKNIRGIAYDTVKNVLALTDYVLEGGVSTGKIYLFDNVPNLKTLTALTPSRVITGPLTLLQEPIDVAIDYRSKGKFLYVADQKAKKVFRFKLDANGNAAPDAAHTPPNNFTPVSIALDARTIQN